MNDITFHLESHLYESEDKDEIEIILEKKPRWYWRIFWNRKIIKILVKGIKSNYPEVYVQSASYRLVTADFGRIIITGIKKIINGIEGGIQI
jgi:hypothetical protein